LYLVKYLRPDLANVVRELSKCMDGASLAAYKEMQRVIGQEIPNQESVSLDSLYICLAFQSAGDPRLRRVINCQAAKLGIWQCRKP
jgi:hypothetical protein